LNSANNWTGRTFQRLDKTTRPLVASQIDVTSQPSVDCAAAEVERLYGRLDILVNNAGIAIDWFPASDLTVEDLQGNTSPG